MRRTLVGLMLSMLLVVGLAPQPAHAAVTISTNTAGTRPAGAGTNVWGTAKGAPRAKVWTQVRLPDGRWSTSQTRTTDGAGGYSIPLTYGINLAGRTTYRVGVATPRGAVYSSAFTLNRTVRLSVNAASSKPTGVGANVWGSAIGAPWSKVWTQVRLPDGRWSTSQTRKTNGSGGYSIPLTYGLYTAGKTTWRVVVASRAGTVYSRTFTLTRTGFSLNLAREAEWTKIAQCESGNRWYINTGNGYYGGLQFNYATWHSVRGGDFAQYPHQASREEQITVANRLYAIRGYQPWACAWVLYR